MLPSNIFRPPLNDEKNETFKNEKQLATLTSWKGTTETNTPYFCLKDKLTTDDYRRITIKIP